MVAFVASTVLTAAALNTAFNALTIRTVTGTSDTLVLADNGGAVTYSNASATTSTIPPNSSVAYAVGTKIVLVNLGAGVVTVTAGAGVTVNGTLTIAQNAGGTCIKTATNTWSYLPLTSGPPASSTATVATQQSTTSTSYADLATAGPAVTVTTGTKALVIVTGQMLAVTSAGLTASMSFAVSGATTVAASDTYRAMVSAGTGTTFSPDLQLSAVYLLTTLSAGSNTFTAKYKVNSGTAYFTNRSITVIDMGS